MYKTNPGKFNKRVTLLRCEPAERDEMGGLREREYEAVGSFWAMQRDKTSTYKQVIGDYVTVNTCYFVLRDISSTYPLTTDWRLQYAGYTYVINSITKLDDSIPHYLEIEATRLGGIG